MSAPSNTLLLVGSGAAALWGWSRWRQQNTSRRADAWGAEHDEDEVAPQLEPARIGGDAAAAKQPKATRALSRQHDLVFTVHGMGLPVPYLRALAARESGLNAADPKGLINVVPVVREDFNRRHGTAIAADQLINPMVNVMIATDTLRGIIESYAKHHPDVPSLQEDWTNRHFVELLTFGWNAGPSESRGVGRVVGYLTERGQTRITLADVAKNAHDAGASHWLWAHPKKVAWTRSVADLYVAELARDVAAGRIAQPAPPPPPRSRVALIDPYPAVTVPERLDLGRPVPADVRAIVSSGWARPRKARSHRALDIPLPVGTPILSIDDGIVAHVEKTARGDAGIWVAVTHPTGLTSRYLHLDRAEVFAGQPIARGGTIGRAGNTGDSAGPHLHLDLRAPPALLTAVQTWIGTPRPGWGPALKPWGVSIPGEPWIPVDGYAEHVARSAVAAGLPLHNAPTPPPTAVAAAEPVSRPDQVDDPVGG